VAFDIDRRISHARRRLSALTDARCAEAHRELAAESERNRAWLDARYHFYRRSLGQQLRWLRAKRSAA